MFPQLVKEADTPEQKLIGFIAFGLYEEARREWASAFREREGRYPVDTELRAYEKSWTASRLDGLRNAAIQLVAAYADTVATQLEAEILRGAVKGRFWRGVGQWLFSAVLYTLTFSERLSPSAAPASTRSKRSRKSRRLRRRRRRKSTNEPGNLNRRRFLHSGKLSRAGPLSCRVVAPPTVLPSPNAGERGTNAPTRIDSMFGVPNEKSACGPRWRSGVTHGPW
jgi:hypothetical protein